MIFYVLQAREAVLEAAANTGCEVYAVLGSQESELTCPKERAIYVNDPNDAVEVARLLMPLVEQNSAERHMCIGLGDRSSQCAVLVNASLGLELGRLPTFNSLETMRNKPRMRQMLGAQSSLNGKYWEVQFPGTTTADLTAFLTQSPGGIILKPTDGAGSRDVHVLNSRAEIAKLKIDAGEYLVEQRFVGPEFSVEGISWNGFYQPLVITAKATGGETGLVEIGQKQPASIGGEAEEKLFKAAEEVLAVVGYDYGLSHVEFILEAGEPRLVEAHGRVGGDHIADMMRWSVGGTAFEILFATYENQSLWSGSSGRDVLNDAAVRFMDLRGWIGDDNCWLQQLNALPGVVEAKILKPPEERGPINQSSDRHAYVLIAGADTMATISIVERMKDGYENPCSHS